MKHLLQLLLSTTVEQLRVLSLSSIVRYLKVVIAGKKTTRFHYTVDNVSCSVTPSVSSSPAMTSYTNSPSISSDESFQTTFLSRQFSFILTHSVKLY